jgi:hypothetical protein
MEDNVDETFWAPFSGIELTKVGGVVSVGGIVVVVLSPPPPPPQVKSSELKTAKTNPYLLRCIMVPSAFCIIRDSLNNPLIDLHNPFWISGRASSNFRFTLLADVPIRVRIRFHLTKSARMWQNMHSAQPF